jgi:hypothetical protein
MQTLYENQQVVQAIAPQSVGSGATVTGTGQSCLGFESLLAVIDIGAIADTLNHSLTVKLQESSDDGDSDAYTDITSATTGAVDNDGQNEVYLIELNLSERERYIRAVVTGGSAGGGVVAVDFHLGNPRSAPVSLENAITKIGFS